MVFNLKGEACLKITVIYGNNRKGSTYNSVQLLKEKLNEQGKIDYTEIFLPTDLQEFCRGCFNCILDGEELCHNSNYVQPIIDKMLAADGIILASPVYSLDVSAPMKNLLDHLCYLWIPHRSRTEFFSKIGFVLATAAGTGTKRTNKTLKLSLDYLGFKRVYSYGANVAASDWSGVSTKKKEKIESDLANRADKFYKATLNRKKLRYRPKTRVIFLMMKKLIKGYDQANLDRTYWQEQGWFDNKSPFKGRKTDEDN